MSKFTRKLFEQVLRTIRLRLSRTETPSALALQLFPSMTFLPPLIRMPAPLTPGLFPTHRLPRIVDNPDASIPLFKLFDALHPKIVDSMPRRTPSSELLLSVQSRTLHVMPVERPCPPLEPAVHAVIVQLSPA